MIISKVRKMTTQRFSWCHVYKDSHSSERNADLLEELYKSFWMKMIELSDRAFIYLSIFMSLYSVYYIDT